MTDSVLPVILSLEEMVEEIEKLENPSHIQLDGGTVYRGEHPEHGPVTLFMTAIGNGVMLCVTPLVASALPHFHSIFEAFIV